MAHFLGSEEYEALVAKAAIADRLMAINDANSKHTEAAIKGLMDLACEVAYRVSAAGVPRAADGVLGKLENSIRSMLMDATVSQAIRFEKDLCGLLTRAWAPSGFSIETLLADIGNNLQRSQEEIDRLTAVINTPELIEFSKAVQLEAAHQRERWGSDNDAGKDPAAWFWLVGYLSGRALAHHLEAERLDGVPEEAKTVASNIGSSRHREKAVHHCITAAAALANWHAHVLGLHTGMRPGTEQA